MTYLGGSGDDGADAIAVDAQGNACLTGFTDSPNFPIRNAIQSGIHGIPEPFFGFFPLDAFVAQLDASGSHLLYSTYLGGDGVDQGLDIAVDQAGNLYVTGYTRSPNFPTTNSVTTNAFQFQMNTAGLSTHNVGPVFNDDAFVAKIDPRQKGRSSLIYSTYLGGPGVDRGEGIAVDADGNAYVTGMMDLFPQDPVNPLFDVFVVKLDSTGASMIYGQLLHGSHNDIPLRITVDAAGSAYVTGSTDSTDFPVVPNPFNRGGVYKSTDAGASWSLSSAGLSRNVIRSLAIDPSAPSTVYAGTREGVFNSFDAAGNWSSSANALIYHVISNSPTSWSPSLSAFGFHAVTSIAIDPRDPPTVYAGAFGAGLFESTDGGATWARPVTTNGTVNPNINALLVDPLVPGTLYAGTSAGFFKSTNNAGTWRISSTGLSSPDVRVLAIDTTIPALYAGTAAGVARSTNGGGRWTMLTKGLTFAVNALALDPAVPSTIYAGTAAGVFQSLNGGSNWTAFNTGLVSHAINALAAAPATIYAGTARGLFRRTDSDSSWTALTNGLTTANIASLAIDPGSPDTIYAGTRAGLASGVNCFVSKISSDGTGIAYSTVLSGSGTDRGWDLAVDNAGNAYVVGTTTSHDFPVTNAPAARYTNNSGGSDAFVLELDPNGSGLIYSFYLGGRADDSGYGIGLDQAGNAYLAGQTASGNFPITSALRPAFAGGPNDAFVTKIQAQPSLAIARSGNNLVLSWHAPAPEFVLEVSNSGMQTADWNTVPQTPSVTNGLNTVTVNISGAHQKFRLRRQY
jgi:photosystem II stability/assembly factor-like uncharacterized protein